MATRPLATAAPVFALIVCVLLSPPARGEDETRNEFWPEVDAYARLSGRSRLHLLATISHAREVDYAEAMVGGHVDFFLKPILRSGLRDTPDVFKRRYLSFRIGYRYAQALGKDADSYREHRPLLEATGRVYALGRAVLLDRSRFDFRNVNGDWSWRYRNRIRIEREVPAWSSAVTPYAMVELFYDSRYAAWNRQRYFVGVEWPTGKKSILDSYYVRQNDSRSSPAHLNAFGLAVNLFF